MKVLVLAVALLASCAHVQNVAEKCEGTVTPGLIADFRSALSQDDYEAAVTVAAFGILPCLAKATIAEIAVANTDPAIKASLGDSRIKAHAAAWLAAHK